MKTDWKKRSNKEAVRDAVINHAKSMLGTSKGYLFLPGWDPDANEAGQCFQLGVEKKLITPETRCIGFECDGGVVDNISNFFATKYSDYDVKVRHSYLEKSRLEPNSIDFAFLDFTGNVNEDTYHWMRNILAPALTENAVVAITQPFGREVPELFNLTKERLATDLDLMRKALMKQFDLWGELDIDNAPGNIWGKYTLVVIGLTIFKCALRGYHSQLAHEIMVYHDKTETGNHIPMYTMIFDQIRPRTDAPVYPELILRKEDKTMTTRSKAAFKAHTTRRANALFAKRSAAAKKAWRTRRAQA